jgi:hypothetical protein
MEQESFFSEKIIVGSTEEPAPFASSLMNVTNKYNITDLNELDFLNAILQGDDNTVVTYLNDVNFLNNSSDYLFDAALELLPASLHELYDTLNSYKNTKQWLRNQ